ncbi:hypothetical protein [[Mycoplasma] gypis]|uniref:Uncharacterized protein n=1 Tax=[Mycoplasma] gypis TaxID=92404 RepID=A0ABZ2RMB2_9BACT|nr:hypothetical protein [[Mycoplasma] gypis]MBN0919128.1 hypothetical protein [[Mycoplasma] gypis]
MKKLKLKKLKKFLLALLFVLIGAFTCIAIGLKVSSPYRVSIYNYESYLAKPIIQKINKQYSYRLFSEINQFTRAIDQGKTVGGVGSDYQIATLIYENKLQKIDYSLIFNDVALANEDQKEEKIKNHFTDITWQHMKNFDNWIYQKIQSSKGSKSKILSDSEYDVDGDGVADRFYQYMIPYFIQDKIVAYNINKKYRNYIKPFDENFNNDLSWQNIYKTLKQNNYHTFGWTNSFLDNLMIGQFYSNNKSNETVNQIKNESIQKFMNLSKESTNLTKEIDQITNGFTDFVKNTTSWSIKDTRHNRLITNGLELVNDLIDPNPNKLDVGLMYNGDVLDSYYSHDNFSELNDGENINFVRPQLNLLLLDGWIISKNVEKKDAQKLQKFLRDNLFSAENIDIEKEFLSYLNWKILN